MTADGLKWEGHAVVAQYDPDTVRFIASKTGLDVNVIGDADHPLAMFDRYLSGPDRIVDAGHNLLTTVGVTAIVGLIAGASAVAGQPMSPTSHAFAGVGATNTAAVVGNVALAADTGSAYYQVLDATYPQEAAGVLTAYSTFTAANADFVWAEWCLGTVAGTITPGATLASIGTTPKMWNRAVAALGTKVSPAVWTIQASITIS
jgi:hypothetical protein